MQVQVEGGNHAALRALLGQSQDQTFTLGATTEILVWSHGVPHVAAITDLHQGDEVTVRVRAPNGASLAAIEGTPAAVVADHGASAGGAGKPLYLYVGTVTGAAVRRPRRAARDGRQLARAAVDARRRRARPDVHLRRRHHLPALAGQGADRHRPVQLKAGDRITVRVRAPRTATLAQVEATPATHIGDHEPGNPQTQN